MTGTELKAKINKSYDSSITDKGGLEGLWQTKLRQAKREGFGHGHGIYQSIKEKGWVSDDPIYGHVDLTHKTVRGAIPAWDRVDVTTDDAHHRIAAAAAIEGYKPSKKKGQERYGKPNYIPVTHWDNRDYGMP